MQLLYNSNIQNIYDFVVIAIPGLETRWEEINCFFLLYVQNDITEIKISALKSLKISTKTLTITQRQNYYCILSTLIESDISDSIRNETLCCLKELAKFYKEEINTEMIQPKFKTVNRKQFYKLI